MFVERIKIHKGWKDAETNLTKKREAKVKLELANKTDKIPQATAEVKEVREMHRIDRAYSRGSDPMLLYIEWSVKNSTNFRGA